MKRTFYPPVVTVEQLRRRPYAGWLQAARRALGLTLKKLGQLTDRSPQAIRDAEQRELDGSISLARLREIGAAMDMELVYGFVPKGGSVEELLLQRAREKATGLLSRASHHMLLENQTNHVYDSGDETEILAKMLIEEEPQSLWV